jgi:hypothetical protein
MLRELMTGQAAVANDAQTVEGDSEALRAGYERVGIGAMMIYPILKNGRKAGD